MAAKDILVKEWSDYSMGMNCTLAVISSPSLGVAQEVDEVLDCIPGCQLRRSERERVFV
jgi:hypothetical protein